MALTFVSTPQPEATVQCARKIWERCRPAAVSQERAIDAAVRILRDHRERLPVFAPPPDKELLLRMAINEGWEEQYQARRLKDVLGDNEPARRLDDLRALRDERALLVEARSNALAPIRDGDELSRDNASAYEKYSNLVMRLDGQIQTLEREVRAAALERSDNAASIWATRENELYKHMTHTYGGNGPAYEMLCRQLAEIRTRVEQVRASGRDIPPEEFDRIHKLQVSVIAQIQKHTETTKSETLTRDVNAAALAILHLIESEVADEYPTLWVRIVNRVQQRLGVSTDMAALAAETPDNQEQEQEQEHARTL